MNDPDAQAGSARAVQAQPAAAAADAWHAIPARQALDRLQSLDAGLTDEEAACRLERYGANALPRGGGNEALKIFLRQIAG